MAQILCCNFTGMLKWLNILGFIMLVQTWSSAQLDTVKIGLDTYIVVPAGSRINYDSLFKVNLEFDIIGKYVNRILGK